MSVVTLSSPGVESVRLDGSAQATGLLLRGLSGWLSSPTAKVDLSERAAGDGAHDVMAAQILYAARTVIIEFRVLAAQGADRDGVLAMVESLRTMLQRSVSVRVQDGERDLTATGYVDSVEITEHAQNMNWQTMTGQVTIVCPRPELLSTSVDMCQVQCRSVESASGGLSYNPLGLLSWWEGEPNNSPSVLEETLAGDMGLRYPLTYTLDDGDEDASNLGILHNHGSAKAYPVFTVNGPMPDGVDLVFPGTGLHLACSQSVYAGSPLTLDCRTRTATVNGVDVSDTLTSRGFPHIEPASDLTVLLRTIGDGWVDCSVHDTYM